MTDGLLDAGVAACHALGYRVTRRTDGPPAVATPTDSSRPFPGSVSAGRVGAAGTDGPPEAVAIEPLAADAVTPTMLVSRLWNDSRHDRRALFVVPRRSADDAVAVLRSPPLLRGRSPDGLRSFYVGPDRVPLAEGGYAAVRAGAHTPTFDWTEEAATGPLDDPTATAAGADAATLTGGAPGENGAGGEPTDPARRPPGDAPSRLVLRAGSEPAAVLDGVDELCCPTAATFPYAYRRGSDRRFHVRAADGGDVGTFDGVAAMRRAGFHPVPMPLVPEHVLPPGTRVADAWLVLAVPDDAVGGGAPLADATLYAAGGSVALDGE